MEVKYETDFQQSLLSKLYAEREKTGDIEFYFSSSSERVKAHKFILAACSQYFETLLLKIQNEAETDCEYSEKADAIAYKEISEKFFRLILEFIYLGAINESKLSDEDIITAYNESQEIRFTEMNRLFFEKLKNITIKTENIDQIYKLATKYQCADLLKQCSSFIEKHSFSFIEDVDVFKLFSSELAYEIIKNAPNKEEIDKLRAIIEWHETNQSSEISQLLQLISFDRIDASDLYETIRGTKLCNSILLYEKWFQARAKHKKRKCETQDSNSFKRSVLPDYEDMSISDNDMENELTIDLRSSEDSATVARKEMHKIFTKKIMCKLYLNNKLSDLVFKYGETVFPAQKIILVESCDHFKSLMSKSDSRVEKILLDEIPPASLHLILKFIYTGHAELDELDENQLLDLCKISKKILIKELFDSITSRLQEIWNKNKAKTEDNLNEKKAKQDNENRAETITKIEKLREEVKGVLNVVTTKLPMFFNQASNQTKSALQNEMKNCKTEAIEEMRRIPETALVEVECVKQQNIVLSQQIAKMNASIEMLETAMEEIKKDFACEFLKIGEKLKKLNENIKEVDNLKSALNDCADSCQKIELAMVGRINYVWYLCECSKQWVFTERHFNECTKVYGMKYELCGYCKVGRISFTINRCNGFHSDLHIGFSENGFNETYAIKYADLAPRNTVPFPSRVLVKFINFWTKSGSYFKVSNLSIE
ncbi:BTB/POZ domain-containing protein 9-like protein [Dinothrombium tinctorium]|uniref:BTB/POZ domain-containing protein 9-like protein n=1 Tax=Dinothrombium tinctorium TaxID=1965070 RepID=A0A3S3NHH6_9ACAR|nr:BTB/POZ domain-containing protein 9-like protein [Dinothrombium tinctorium]